MEHDAETTLRSALRYIGAYYGGTLAHHILSLALRQALYPSLNQERQDEVDFWESHHG